MGAGESKEEGGKRSSLFRVLVRCGWVREEGILDALDFT